MEDLDLYTDGELKMKFQSLISQSTQIHQGPPEMFLLNTVKETHDDSGKVRRWTFGEKNQSKTRTILMMGEIGTGKSTLINVMVNYILGVDYNDNVRFEIIEEEKRSQTESQTTAITVYEIYGNEGVRIPFSLRLIDTPGYMDTAGEKQDEQIAKNISKLFNAKWGVQQIDAVCFVVNASQNRLTATQLYIFDAILSLFGKDIENNIMALLTFSDGRKSSALKAIDKAGVLCARNEKNQPISFKFNNLPKINDDRDEDDDDDDDDDDLVHDENYWQRNWEMGEKSMQKFFESLDKMETRSLQMTRGESTSKFQSLISQSTQIHQGPPETFLLNTVKETLDDSGKVRRWTFGEKNQSKTRTILMMGETGTGKSTLINVMVNYILGVDYDDNVRFEIIEEEKRSQTESQTTDITVYEIYGNEGVRVPFSLRLIDTPGYMDTAGERQDEQISKNLRKLFSAEEGVDQIDAVCFVVMATQQRLTDGQHYIFDAILSLFGKDIENNIMALITHSDARKPGALAAIDKAGIPCARNKKNQPIFFKFNNVSKVNDDCGDDEEEEEESSKRYWQQNWEMGVKSMQKFFKSLDKMETRSLQMTQAVLTERDQLEMNIQSLQDQITEVENLQNMLKQTQDALEKHKEDIDANKDFKYEVDEPCKIKVDTESGHPATCCKKCETNCHYPCTFVSVSKLNWCAVMEGGTCTVCEKKCSYKDHIKENKMYKQSTRRVTKTFEKLKKHYEEASGEKGTAEDLVKNIQKDLSEVMSDKSEYVEDSYQHILSLFNIALRPDSRSTLQHLDFLLERLRETGTEEQIQKIEEIKRRAGEFYKHKYSGSPAVALEGSSV